MLAFPKVTVICDKCGKSHSITVLKSNVEFYESNPMYTCGDCAIAKSNALHLRQVLSDTFKHVQVRK